MSIPLFIVDAFVGTLGNRVLRGNPAAVALLAAARDDDWMQAVAAEMNLSETAFIVPRGEGDFDLRWFTPRVEVALCGHATLAGAHVLWEAGCLGQDKTIHFHTLSGILNARHEGERVALDFPMQCVTPCDFPRALAECLGLEVSKFPVKAFRASDDWLVEVHPRDFASLSPTFSALRRFSLQKKLRGVIVTAQGEGEVDFVSRFFAPSIGINEDPVTGSAHTKLATYWGERLGKTEMLGYQASERGGLVRVKWREDSVELGGQTRTMARGEWLWDS